MSESHNMFALLKSESAINRIIILILLCYPAFLLTVRGSVGVLFFLLLLLSLVTLYRARKSPRAPHWDKYSIAFALAMSSPVLAIFLSQAYHGEFKAPYYDWAARFLLAIPIFLALRQTSIRVLSILQYGMPIGALVGLLALKLHPFDWGGRYTTSEFFNLIHFSDTALVLGFLSLFSINWKREDSPSILAFKLCGFLAGIYMSIQSGERGSWVAIPLLLLLWTILNVRERRWLKFGIAALVVISASWLSYLLIDVVHTRIGYIFSDIDGYAHGNKDTSVGVRIQLYLAALHLFIEHPFFGVGPGGFAQAIPDLVSSGKLTYFGGVLGKAEIHNEILAKCAETGLFGLLSILSVYLVPAAILWRSLNNPIAQKMIAGMMGLGLITGFFVFGLTVEIFDLKMTAAFYALTLAVIVATATNCSSHETLIDT